MSRLDVKAVKGLLERFEFKELFIEQLGWENPRLTQPYAVNTDEVKAQGTLIAELGGVVVIEIAHDPLPDAKQRERIHRAMRGSFAERVLIFVDRERTRSCWSWVKVDGKKDRLRDHFYFKGEPPEGFIGKIASLSVDLAEYDPDGRFGLQAASNKVKAALDVQRVVKGFYERYKDVKNDFVLAIQGIDDPGDRAWYASVVLNRLTFVYFLQKGLFLDGGDPDYLEKKLAAHRGDFYQKFLVALFFEAFAKPQPSSEARRLCGGIPYLNGGLFRPHKMEEKYAGRIDIPTEAFDPIIKLFGGYSWTFNDVPDEPDKTINPDVLGYIFEKYINQKEFGAYYTPHEITDYLCHQTIHRLILDKMADQGYKGHDSVGDMLLNLKGDGLLFLLKDVLPSISLLDPACGSGAFLYAALGTLLVVYTSAMGRITDLRHEGLDAWRAKEFAGHRSELYWLKKRIITDNLYGVDIMEEAVEIAKLRLFMALVSSARPGETLEPLPNIDFNILPGNSLIGLMRVEDEAFDKQRDRTASLFGSSLDYAELVHRKNIATNEFRHPREGSDPAQLAKDVDKLDAEALPKLNAMLLEAFHNQKVIYEEATWDPKTGKEGKPKKRPVDIEDVEVLDPFHWGYEFNERFANGRGFDAIITNPPWETLKPQDKEFFAKYSRTVSTNKMLIQAFEAHKADALRRNPALCTEYTSYLSRFPYQKEFFRSSPDYIAQRGETDAKRFSIDFNLFKLFTERCYRLLRPGGLMGIVIPSSFYSDMGATGLRRLFFDNTEVTGLFGFENRRTIFEGVDSRFKFVVLSARKGGITIRFPAAFMRTEVKDLRDFPRNLGLDISVDLIKRTAPDTLSITEFKSEIDLEIVNKLFRFPALGVMTGEPWHVVFGREFHMTDDSRLFSESPCATCLPMYEGKSIHQFDAAFSRPRYWIDEMQGRAALGAREGDSRLLRYQHYRLGFRRIARNTDARTLISTILPKNGFVSESITLTQGGQVSQSELLFLCTVLNSFVLDFAIRLKVAANISMFYVYQLPVPRYTISEQAFAPLATRAARLICTTSEFSDLWTATMADERMFAAAEATVRGGEPPVTRTWSPACGATQTALRGRLRAEIDGLVAHLYGLTEEEFNHILSTFPLVPEPTIIAARNAYRDVVTGVVA